MRFTRWQDLLTILVVAALASWLLVRTSYGSIPPLPRFAGLTLLALAVAELVLAFVLRSRIQRRGERRDDARLLDPLMAARSVALAKASSLVGSLMAGLWGGLLLYTAQNRAVLTAAAQDLPGAAIGVVSSLLLVAAALWLEQCCRTPHDDEPARPDDRDD
ncbi:DUF3180 domain-containing protein [Rhodococcus sp. X156]|uniref:DUF3180 domain-containing protein n=1 Tax=Rhodococcus sp. X156 TaxID=2499145 RepID=UPI000FDC9F1C|nr:DUF3180 domain-containing protein [Rhodococcus sp. X156]